MTHFTEISGYTSSTDSQEILYFPDLHAKYPWEYAYLKLLSDADIGVWILHRKHLSMETSADVNEAVCIKCFEFSGRVEKHSISTGPFDMCDWSEIEEL